MFFGVSFSYIVCYFIFASCYAAAASGK